MYRPSLDGFCSFSRLSFFLFFSYPRLSPPYRNTTRKSHQCINATHRQGIATRVGSPAANSFRQAPEMHVSAILASLALLYINALIQSNCMEGGLRKPVSHGFPTPAPYNVVFVLRMSPRTCGLVGCWRYCSGCTMYVRTMEGCGALPLLLPTHT